MELTISYVNSLVFVIIERDLDQVDILQKRTKLTIMMESINPMG